MLYSESKFYSYLETLAFFRVPRHMQAPRFIIFRPIGKDAVSRLILVVSSTPVATHDASARPTRRVDASGQSGSDELFFTNAIVDRTRTVDLRGAYRRVMLCVSLIYAKATINSLCYESKSA